MDLFKLTVPSGPIGSEELYIKVNKGTLVIEGNECVLSAGSFLSTDTYFNIFSSSKYSQYTKVSNVSYRCLISGNADVNLCICDKSGNRTVETKHIDSKDPVEVSFKFNIDGLTDRNDIICHYVSFDAHSETKILSLGEYSADLERNDVRLGISICTFKREEYVTETVRALERLITDPKYDAANIKVYVVDNGRTLNDMSSKNIKLIPNRNLGGSGGFAKGIMEACDDGCTHTIIMDDDVMIDANSVYKTLNLLRVMRDEYRDAFILGGMFSMDNPTVQYEAGARYVGSFVRTKGGLDMTQDRSLLRNDRWESADYGGWWFCCIPLHRKDILPVPMFIKMDDVEHGMRLMKDHLVVNGIGLWHEDFNKKKRRIPDRYYYERNSKVAVALHWKRDMTFPLRYWYMVFFDIASKDYTGIEMRNMALADYLKGADHLINTTEEEKQAELQTINDGAEPYTGEKNGLNIIKELFRRRFWSAMLSCSKMYLFYMKNNKRAIKDYCDNRERLSDRGMWEKRFE